MTNALQGSTKRPRRTKSEQLEDNALYDAAMNYVRRGWSVFPLLPGKKTPYGGTSGFKEATTNGGTVRDWWGQTPKANVGIATGAVSGLFVVDVDADRGGEKTLAEMEKARGPLPQTLVSRTGGGGRHILFKHPGDGLKVVSRNDSLGPGVDVKGDGGYVVAPPSVHPNGTVYEWGTSPEDVKLAGAPSWLLECVTEKADAISVFSVLSAFSVTGVEDAIRLTLPDGPGQRYRRIFAFARGLKALPVGKSAAELEPHLRQWFSKALPFIRTKDYDETRADFLVAWSNVKYPMGAGKLDAIVARARSAPLPKMAERYTSQELRLLVAVCRELQREAGEGPFYLSVRVAGGLMGLDRTTAWRRLLLLQDDDVIVEVEKGTKQRATRWRYLGPMDE